MKLERVEKLASDLNCDLEEFNLKLIVKKIQPTVIDLLMRRENFSIYFDHSLDQQTTESILVKEFFSCDFKKLTKTIKRAVHGSGLEKRIARVLLKNYFKHLNFFEVRMDIDEIKGLMNFPSHLLDNELLLLCLEIKDSEFKKIIMKEMSYLTIKESFENSSFYEMFFNNTEIMNSFNEILLGMHFKERYVVLHKIHKYFTLKHGLNKANELLNKYKAFKGFLKAFKSIAIKDNQIFIQCSEKSLGERVKCAYELFKKLPFNETSIQRRRDVYTITHSIKDGDVAKDVFVEILFDNNVDIQKMREIILKNILDNRLPQQKKVKLKI